MQPSLTRQVESCWQTAETWLTHFLLPKSIMAFKKIHHTHKCVNTLVGPGGHSVDAAGSFIRTGQNKSQEWHQRLLSPPDWDSLGRVK